MRKVGYLRSSDRRDLRVRSPGSLRAITMCAVLVDLVAIGVVLASIPGTRASLWLVVCLALLILLAGQHEVIFGDQTALNDSMVVLLAAAGTFVGGGAVWIPVFCGLLGGLNWDHVRACEVRKLVVNGACTTLAAVLAAALAEVAHPIGNVQWLAVLTSGALAAFTYWLVDNGLIAVVLTAVDGRSLLTHARELMRSETLLVPFGVAGFVSGYYALHGLPTWAAALAVLGVLFAADLVIVSGHATALINLASRMALVGALGVCLIGLAISGLSQRPPDGVELVELIAVTGAGAYVLQRARQRYGSLFVVLCTATSCLVFHVTAPVFAPLSATLAGVVVLRATRRQGRAEIDATVLCAFILVGADALLPALTSSPALLVVAGLVMGTAAWFGWHLAIALHWTWRTGGGSWNVAIDVMRADLPVFITIGLCAAGIAYLGLTAGFFAATWALLVVPLLPILAMRTRVSSRADSLNEYQITDVVRSALLDLPASRLPDDL
jgi:hypothetical protein